MACVIPIPITITLTIITSIIAFYLYKKTFQYALLSFGALAYIELLARVTQCNMDIFTIPEILCLGYLIYMVFKPKTRSWYILIIVCLEAIFYIYGTLKGYDAEGLGGMIFILLFLLWFEFNKTKLLVDPWEKSTSGDIV